MQPRSIRTVEVDFPFDAEVVPKGFRNPRHLQFLGRTPVAVRETSEAPVPIAEISGHRERHDARAPVRRPAVLSAFEGRLWTPLLDREERPLDAETFLGAAGHEAPFSIGNPFDLDRPHLAVSDPDFRPFAADAEAGFPKQRIADTPLRRTLSSREEQAARDAQRVADSLLIADGLVYYRCHEPYWSAHPYADEAFLVFGPEDDVPSEGHPRMETFRADRFDDMIAWRARWAAADGGGPLSGGEGGVRVLSDGALSRNDLAYACRGLKDLAEDSYRFFREAPADTIVHWARLRDVSRELEHGWTDARGAAALEAVAVLRGSFAGLPVRGRDYSRNAFETAHRSCRRLLARAHWFEGWDNPRNVELSVDDAKAIEAMDDWKLARGGPA